MTFIFVRFSFHMRLVEEWCGGPVVDYQHAHLPTEYVFFCVERKDAFRNELRTFRYIRIGL